MLTFGQIRQAWPILGNLLREVLEGIAAGRSNDQIRERLSRADVVSDKALDEVRGASKAVSGFIEEG